MNIYLTDQRYFSLIIITTQKLHPVGSFPQKVGNIPLVKGLGDVSLIVDIS